MKSLNSSPIHFNYFQTYQPLFTPSLRKVTPDLVAMVAMVFLLKKPFKIVSFNSPVNLVHLHLHEIRARAVQALQVEESSNNKHQMESPTNRASVAIMQPNGDFNFSFWAPSRLYSASVYKDGSSTSLCPESVLVTPLSVSGPTREHAVTEILKIRLDLGLNSCRSSKHKFCFLESQAAADERDENHVDPVQNRANYIPDLNFSPPEVTVPVTEFVREIESQNVSRFIEYVCRYLGEHIGGDEVAEYKKIMSCITETQLGNLDTIQILNTLTVQREIKKALVNKGVTKTPIRFGDLPSLQKKQLPAPPPDFKAAANRVIDFNYKLPCLHDDETLSDARNYAIRDGDQSSKAKRKKPYLYDFLEIKKPRRGGALRIDDAKALSQDNAPIYEAEDLPLDTDSDSDSD